MVGLRDILSEPSRKQRGSADQATQSTRHLDQLPVMEQDLTDPVTVQVVQCSDQLPVMEQDLTDTVTVQVVQCSDQLPVTEQDLTDTVTAQMVQCSDRLPILTDAEVMEVLRGLEETFSAAEIEELLGGLEETSNVGESSGHYIDDEIDSVLNMCVADYVV